MARTVTCAKIGKELEGVVGYKPFENELGQRIYDNISPGRLEMVGRSRTGRLS